MAAWEPAAIRDLFFRPGRFFGSRAVQLRGPAVVLAAWLVGMNFAIGRIERQMVRADLGQESGTALIVSSSWLKFWGVVAVAGVVSAAFAWYVGTWWYRVRLRWSGAVDPSVARARAVYLFSGLIWAVPSLLATFSDTLRFPTFADAWASESPWDLVLLVFPIWACWVSYRGVRATFDVRPGRAHFWFLIAPIMAFLLAFGVIAALYARLG
jgi:hypothetical protein